MKKIFVILFAAILFYGCATVQPQYEAYNNIQPVSDADLSVAYIDLTGRPDAADIIQKKAFTKIGLITYDVIYTDAKLEKLKIFAKEQGADAFGIRRKDYKWDNILDCYYGILVETIKYK